MKYGSKVAAFLGLGQVRSRLRAGLPVTLPAGLRSGQQTRLSAGQ